jgi:hypothetical protein
VSEALGTAVEGIVHARWNVVKLSGLKDESEPLDFTYEVPTLEEAQAVLAALAVLAGERKANAAYALAELLSRRGLERPCEALVAWARKAYNTDYACPGGSERERQLSL